MKNVFIIAACVVVCWVIPAFAASPAMVKAKGEAEAQGFLFADSHEEIVEKAKKEGRLRAIVSLQSATITSLVKGFREKYPFLAVHAEEISGTEAGERFLLELKARRAQGWDISRASTETFTDYIQHAKKVDLLGMAEHGVLAIPPKIVDSKSRKAVAVSSTVGAMALNKCVLDPAKAPQRWEDLLKPEFKGRKFIVDLRPLNFTPMAAGAGEEWLLNFAKKLAAQQPVWLRGHERAMPLIASGEHPLHSLTNYHSVIRAIEKDPRGCLQAKVIEPVPVRLNEPEMIVETAAHPYAGLLWLEFLVSPAGQRIIDEQEPLKSSIYVPGSALEKVVREKKVWLFDWNNFDKGPGWVDKMIEAFGFPQAEKK